jgi:hypothetical protein
VAEVSLVKDRPPLILPQELASVEAALDRHPKSNNYRVAVQKKQVMLYERLGPDEETLTTIFGQFVFLPPLIEKKRIHEQLDKMARFSPIMRFTLLDPQERDFNVKQSQLPMAKYPQASPSSDIGYGGFWGYPDHSPHNPLIYGARRMIRLDCPGMTSKGW